MKINLLGSLSIAHGDELVAVPSRRVRAVLALLALNAGRPLPFDQLVDELWANRPMANARNALQANVVRLRKLIESVTGRPGDRLLRTVNHGYVLEMAPADTDIHWFYDLADRGAAAVTREPQEAIGLLERSLRLWRGPALFDTLDGPRCRIEATRLNERRLGTYEDLITAKLAVGQTRQVLTELRQLTAEYPEHERFSEQLMVALYRNGRQVEALDVFHRARQQLAEDLGLEPGPAMHQLYRQILVRDSVLG
ncbi:MULTISPECIES: AfsR/SARP family transcriptional regulator [Dactylosporangium]|uniref:SARP family transcriptional regulator n=2 Tax=Dactylosporangium TaxID=35753 RepID=A0A9W6NK61_9ACTN|nr:MULTISPECIES: AfsR/SARP family transcriptional regulator [Dactylosporangium]UAB94065.1 AfsR/SARP family transcriptional regulator [Dactylosporangium vinaceum]UWZ42476.1 AfsR/SARP family transcriptional regulator [Dactylosporangium matsuzakiense]GLL00610.1 SARP family transcriptional regulator [Dactylosporangium matsuzakiense]